MVLASTLGDAVQSFIGRDAIVFALAAMGINLHFGYTGLLNFGQVGWMAVGAYGVAFAVLDLGLALAPAIGFALVCSVGLSMLLGLPTLRLRADYLAIVTVAAGELIRIVARAASLSDVTGGSSGLPGRNDPPFNSAFYRLNPFDSGFSLGPATFNQRQTFFMVVGWATVLAVGMLIAALVRGPWGRVLRAIREDEDAAKALGKNAFWFKVQVLVLGGAIGSLAGVLLALESGSVQPDSYSPPVTYFAWTCLIIGGVGRVWGPVIGAMIFWAILSLTEDFLGATLRDVLSDAQVGQIRFVLVGVGLAVLMIVRPQGIFGSREEMVLDAR